MENRTDTRHPDGDGNGLPEGTDQQQGGGVLAAPGIYRQGDRGNRDLPKDVLRNYADGDRGVRERRYERIRGLYREDGIPQE